MLELAAAAGQLEQCCRLWVNIFTYLSIKKNNLAKYHMNKNRGRKIDNIQEAVRLSSNKIVPKELRKKTSYAIPLGPNTLEKSVWSCLKATVDSVQCSVVSGNKVSCRLTTQQKSLSTQKQVVSSCFSISTVLSTLYMHISSAVIYNVISITSKKHSSTGAPSSSLTELARLLERGD